MIPLLRDIFTSKSINLDIGETTEISRVIICGNSSEGYGKWLVSRFAARPELH